MRGPHRSLVLLCCQSGFPAFSGTSGQRLRYFSLHASPAPPRGEDLRISPGAQRLRTGVAGACGVACGLRYLLPEGVWLLPEGRKGTFASLILLHSRLFPPLGVPSAGGERGQVWTWWRWGNSSPAAGIRLPSQQWSTGLLWQKEQHRPSSFQFFSF